MGYLVKHSVEHVIEQMVAGSIFSWLAANTLDLDEVVEIFKLQHHEDAEYMFGNKEMFAVQKELETTFEKYRSTVGPSSGTRNEALS